MSSEHEKFLKRAVEVAQAGMNCNNGGPFGAVIVKDGEIIAEGCNRVTSTNDPTAHAEVVAIRQACEKLGTFQLEGCTVYASCEPCPMCLGAIYWARPERVVFSSTRHDAAEIGFDDEFLYEEMAHDINNRRIEFLRIPTEEADSLFKSWDDKEDKTEY